MESSILDISIAAFSGAIEESASSITLTHPLLSVSRFSIHFLACSSYNFSAKPKN
jgi:hypothetical protein